MPSRPGATLRDIADSLGLSASTVSRALSGHPAISESTREAVVAAARALDYGVGTRPVARSATSARGGGGGSRLVGVVVGALHNRFMTLLLEHLHDALQEAGYQVTLLIDSLREPEQLQAFRPLIEDHLAGMIIATATVDTPVVAELKRLGLPLVLAVRSVDGVEVDTVEVDNVQAGIDVARHLWDLGHRRIGLVMGPQNTSTSRDRVKGLLDFLAARGITPDAVQLLWGDYTTESGYSNTMRLLAPQRRVTAIAAGNDTIALGVLEAARRREVAVPRQLSVIGFDDIPLAGSPLVQLTTIRQPVEAIARSAAARLLERIRSGDALPVSHETLPIELIRRLTTGPAPGQRGGSHASRTRTDVAEIDPGAA